MDLIYRLACAIAQQEGFFSEKATRPQWDFNPGDLRDAPWLTHPKHDGGYWKADSIAQGVAGIFHQIALDVARGMSLRQLVNAWAPAADGNNPAVYLQNVMRWTGITDADQPLWNLLTPLQKLS